MQQVSYNNHDIRKVSVVPVIASFDSEGHIKPLYVRIDGMSCRVLSYWIKSTFINFVAFNCMVQVGELAKPVTLTYFIDETIWTMPNAAN
jgi:hypothetical protein